MSAAYTVLITGSNRGIGLGLTKRYLAQPNTTVVAAVRDVSKSAQALQELPKGKDSKVIIVKIDSTSATDALDSVKEIEKQGINHLDLVIANAGVANVYPSVKDLKIEDLQFHLEANLYGPVVLYQATTGLLAKAPEPKWVTIGSMAGQISEIYPIPNAAYSPTKIAVHWMTKKIDLEEENLCAFIIHPGFVATDMGNFGANQFGMEGGPPTSVDESCDGIVKVTGEATKKTHGGKLYQFTGEAMPW